LAITDYTAAETGAREPQPGENPVAGEGGVVFEVDLTLKLS